MDALIRLRSTLYRVTCAIGFCVLLAASGCATPGWVARGSREQADSDRSDTSRYEEADPLRRRGIVGRARRAEAEKAESHGDAGQLVREIAKARSMEGSGKLEDARQVYQKLVRDFPDRHEPYHRLGLVADRQRRHREAESLYTQALQMKPLDAAILNNLGYCYYLQGKLEKAESALLKAVDVEPSNALYRNNLGLVYGQLGQFEEALASFRRAGSEADAQYNLAFVLASQEEPEKAKKRFQIALAADPGHEQARQALASFEHYDETAEDLREQEPAPLADGRRWVPYVEGQADVATEGDGPIRQTSAIQERVRQAVQSRVTRNAYRR